MPVQEIVPDGDGSPRRPEPGPSSASSSTSRRGAFFGQAAGAPEPFDSEKLPPTLVPEIRRFLRVANQIEAEAPRVAYLCRFHAFERAHIIDPTSSGRGVRQFKTALLQRLELDDEETKWKRKAKNDARELKSFFQKMNLKKERVIVCVIFEVLKAVLSEAGLDTLAAGVDLEGKSCSYSPYNIIPLGLGGGQQAILHLPEIKASISAVRDVRGLPLAQNSQERGGSLDLFDILQGWFGFQHGNVANQREHLILLLANIQVRLNPKPISMSKLDDRSVSEVMMRIFQNYLNWCKYLGRNNNIWLPSVKKEVQQHKILYIGLYLLIWGEASNLRLMPECLCYIFHHMAYELYGVLSGATCLNTGKNVVPVYGGEPEAFLKNVVCPIYRVVSEESQKNKNGSADHSTWRNYDDLNEFFWSIDCFKLGWPLRLDHEFFWTSTDRDNSFQDGTQTNESAGKWSGKLNFVEVRSFWHLFRSFDRMWTFLTLSLQALIIMAYHDLETPFQLLNLQILTDLSSIFITNAILRLVQVALDVIFMWKARQTMRSNLKLRFLMKFVVAVSWAFILPVSYALSSGCSYSVPMSNVDNFCLSEYAIAALIYFSSNVIGIAFFFVPAISCYIETSNMWLCKLLSWWIQPELYIGRGMQENQVSLIKYTVFWVILLSSKFLFSYQFEIKPLVKSTKQLMQININSNEWHELFPEVKGNAGAIAAVWAPIILVYFMDTQIWYSIFCTIFGGIYGIIHHLGEIRTLGMVKCCFHSLPSVFNSHLIPSNPQKVKEKKKFRPFLGSKQFKDADSGKNDFFKFALVWNCIINNFRLEDIISNREMDLMIMPLSSYIGLGPVLWPLFLLTSKLSTAVNMSRDFVGTYRQLYNKLTKDKYMFFAIKECYESLKQVLDILVIGSLEKRVLNAIFDEVDGACKSSNILEYLNFHEISPLYTKVIQLVEILYENKQVHQDKATILLQDIVEIFARDVLRDDSRIVDVINGSSNLEQLGDVIFICHQPELFVSNSLEPVLRFPLPNSGPLKEKVKRLFLLVTVKDTALDVPTNLEARRRISFFATSLFMDMPAAPKVRNMLSFSVLTPYYMEEVNFSEEELHSDQDGGASIISYMQKIYPDEWRNFRERFNNKETDEEIRYWASFRGQTLSRTVRGMMYYRKALKLQAFLDMASDQDIIEGFDIVEKETTKKRTQQSLSVQLDALTDLKFTYVISCQLFGQQKASGAPHAQDIMNLMIRYPSLRVAYIEEKEELGTGQKVYSSVLVKAEHKLDQEIYRVKLPGQPIIGEGKPENQNHAIIFTRGDVLQTIDMNQDNYLEEALKVRNVLEEFLGHKEIRPPTIVGLREHIFTGSVSSLAGFMSYQETSFVTIGQRFLSDPLRVRFHYGHPDLFDRMFHLTRGGISKASKTINLSEDVFSGFNSTLRQGYITYKEYIQVGKGRDVGLNQISKFEAKVANGNSEQTLSRDMYRLGRRFDFFRMLSCYHTTVGFYFNGLISILGVYFFLYGQLYLVLSGRDKALVDEAREQNLKSLETALSSQSFIQLGLLTALPMIMELGLEKGFGRALSDFILMQLQLASVYFTFSLGTKSHYFGRTLLHGGAKYRPTGRKFVVFHASFTENYQLYSRSHFVKGFEMLFLLIVYNLYKRSSTRGIVCLLATYSSWFMTLTWLFAPFLFNPSGFAWRKIVEDWTNWNKWISNQGGIGVHPDKSWESWWNEEQNHLRHSGLCSRILEIILSLRFFAYQYGLVYHLDLVEQDKSIVVYFLSWLVIASIVIFIKVINAVRQKFSARHHLLFRLFKVLLFIGVIGCVVTLLKICTLSLMDLIICCLAFIPTGWGLLLIAQALRYKLEHHAIWEIIHVIAQAYDYVMGSLIFAPIAALAWMPVVSAIQTRVLFNQAFTRQLQIQPILTWKSKKR